MADIDYNALGIYFFAEYCFNYHDYSIQLDKRTLDKAMKEVIEENNELKLPLRLNFVELNTGPTICIELEKMMQAAYDCEIIKYNEDYTKCIPSISKTCAEAIIKNNDIPNYVRKFSSKVFGKIVKP